MKCKRKFNIDIGIAMSWQTVESNARLKMSKRGLHDIQEFADCHCLDSDRESYCIQLVLLIKSHSLRYFCFHCIQYSLIDVNVIYESWHPLNLHVHNVPLPSSPPLSLSLSLSLSVHPYDITGIRFWATYYIIHGR